MGQCCAKCLISNTCCLCWCGCYHTFVTHHFSKETVLAGKNSDLTPLFGKDDLVKDMGNWKTGDLIFQHTDSSQSTMIATDSPWTHVGIIYKRDDNVDILKMTDEFGCENSNLMSIEAVNEGYKPNGEYSTIGRFTITDVSKWIYTMQNKEMYIGHRSLKVALTDGQLRKLEKKISHLKGAKYGGFGLDDHLEAYSAGVDLSCCYCCNQNSCKQSVNEESLFCSKTTGLLLQEVNIIKEKKNVASEFTPCDFTSQDIWQYTHNSKDPYEPITLYGE